MPQTNAFHATYQITQRQVCHYTVSIYFVKIVYAIRVKIKRLYDI